MSRHVDHVDDELPSWETTNNYLLLGLCGGVLQRTAPNCILELALRDYNNDNVT